MARRKQVFAWAAATGIGGVVDHAAKSYLADHPEDDPRADAVALQSLFGGGRRREAHVSGTWEDAAGLCISRQAGKPPAFSARI